MNNAMIKKTAHIPKNIGTSLKKGTNIPVTITKNASTDNGINIVVL